MRIKKIKKKQMNLNPVVLILFAALVMLLIVIYTNKPVSLANAEQLSETLLSSTEFSFVGGGVMEDGQLQSLMKTDYKKLKNSLGISGDFCIYIEDSDGKVLMAKGDPSLSENGYVCSK